MSASLRLQEIRDGFERPFWVANVSEIFERLSYYGAFSSLAVYLQEKVELLDRANRHAHRPLRRHGLVPGDFRRRRRGQTRLSPRAVDGLSHTGRGVLPNRLDRCVVACARSWRGSAQLVCRRHPDSSRAWHRTGKAMRRRHHRPRFQGKCPHPRLLDLLHHGEYRRHRRPLRRKLGAHALWAGESLSHFRAQRFRDVFPYPIFLSRSAQTGRRAAPSLSRSYETFAR